MSLTQEQIRRGTVFVVDDFTSNTLYTITKVKGDFVTAYTQTGTKRVFPNKELLTGTYMYLRTREDLDNSLLSHIGDILRYNKADVVAGFFIILPILLLLFALLVIPLL